MCKKTEIQCFVFLTRLISQLGHALAGSDYDYQCCVHVLSTLIYCLKYCFLSRQAQIAQTAACLHPALGDI